MAQLSGKVPVEWIVSYLAGRNEPEMARLRRELGDPTSESSQFLDQLRRRTLAMIPEDRRDLAAAETWQSQQTPGQVHRKIGPLSSVALWSRRGMIRISTAFGTIAAVLVLSWAVPAWQTAKLAEADRLAEQRIDQDVLIRRVERLLQQQGLESLSDLDNQDQVAAEPLIHPEPSGESADRMTGLLAALERQDRLIAAQLEQIQSDLLSLTSEVGQSSEDAEVHPDSKNLAGEVLLLSLSIDRFRAIWMEEAQAARREREQLRMLVLNLLQELAHRLAPQPRGVPSPSLPFGIPVPIAPGSTPDSGEPLDSGAGGS